MALDLTTIPERAAFLGILRARQAEMQGLIDCIVAWLESDPPAPARRKRAPTPQQATLFQTEAP